jgi:hypothetical protein
MARATAAIPADAQEQLAQLARLGEYNDTARSIITLLRLQLLYRQGVARLRGLDQRQELHRHNPGYQADI